MQFAVMPNNNMVKNNMFYKINRRHENYEKEKLKGPINNFLSFCICA